MQTELTNSQRAGADRREAKARPTWPGPASRPSRRSSSPRPPWPARAARPSRRSCWPRPTASKRMLAGRGESQRVMQVGLSEAAVLLRKIASFGDPRLYARHRGGRAAGAQQAAAGAGAGVHRRRQRRRQRTRRRPACSARCLSLLVAEKSGFQIAGPCRSRSRSKRSSTR